METGTPYKPPFTSLHVGGPDALFAGKDDIVEQIFLKLKAVHLGLSSKAG